MFLSPVVFLIFMSTAILLPLLLALVRHLVQRTSGIRKSRSDEISEACFALALVMHCAVIGMLLYKGAEEIRIRREMKEEVLQSKTGDGTIDEGELLLKMSTPKFLKLFFFGGCLYICALYTLKAAFISLYWGLFTRASISHRWIKVTISLTMLSIVSVFSIGFAWCRPFHNNWASDYQVYLECSVLNSLVAQIMHVSTNILTDIAILLLPLVVLHRLRLGKREKAALMFVYSIGLLSVIASLARFLNVLKYFRQPNTMYNVHLFEIWTIVEVVAAMFAFSLPTFRKLLVGRVRRDRGGVGRGNVPVGVPVEGGSGTIVGSGGRKKRLKFSSSNFSSFPSFVHRNPGGLFQLPNNSEPDEGRRGRTLEPDMELGSRSDDRSMRDGDFVRGVDRLGPEYRDVPLSIIGTVPSGGKKSGGRDGNEL